MADVRAKSPAAPLAAEGPTVSTPTPPGWLTPERVAHAEFRTSFRGLDATEVRSFLARVASELRAVLDREAELRAEAAEATQVKLQPPAALEELDVRQVTELLGHETARVLETAREAAAEMRAKAEREADTVLEAAQAEAERLRTEAEALLAQRTEEAETAARTLLEEARAEAQRITSEAAALREETDAEVAGLRERAEADAASLAEQAAADAEATREEARTDGRRMVAEARAVRERILTDMARRRNQARQQLERVRAAREQLLEAIEAMRVSVVTIQGELSGALVEAKLAGDRAARTVDVDTLPSMVDLEAEVDLAKDTGLVDVDAMVRSGEELSTVDTGEFAAVTAPEPDVDADEEPGADAPPTSPGPHGMFSRIRDVTPSAVPATPVRDAPDADAPAADAPADEEEVTDEADEADEAGTEVSETDVSETADRVALHTRDAKLAGVVRDLNRHLKLALSDQQNALLEAARGAKGAANRPPLPPADELAASYRAAAVKALTAAAVLGRHSIDDEAADAPGALDDAAVDEIAGELAVSIAGTLTDRLSRPDDEGGPGVEDLRAAYREVRGQRLGPLAEHAAARAFGQGQLSAAAADPPVRLRWVQDGCGPDCLDNALAGPVAAGEPFPTGHPAPPAFVGCRCMLVRAEG